MAGCSLEEVVKRFLELEVSQARLRDQLGVILEREEERRRRKAHGHARRRRRHQMMMMSGALPPRGGRGSVDGELIPAGFFPAGRFADGPYGSVLKHMGHALHVYRSDTGEIIFWNRSAEDLYGWKDQEALGKRVEDLLLHGEISEPNLGSIMEHYITRGQPWSGHLPLKKRSGEMLLAMVTKTPLFDEEDGAVLGVITVAIDAALLLRHGHSEMLFNTDPKVFSRSRSHGDVERQLSEAADEQAPPG